MNDFNEGVFHGFSRPNEIELHATPIRPVLERPRHELGAMVDRDRTRRRPAGQGAIERLADRLAGDAGGHLQDRTLTTPLIDHREHAKRTAIGQRVVDEVHAPSLGRARRQRRRPPMQRDVLPPAHAHPQLQALEAVQPSHALLIHPPALPSQQHPDPREAEPRPRVRELADPEPQRHLVIAGRAAIPRRPTELRQMAGPPHLHPIGRLKPGGQFAAAGGP